MCEVTVNALAAYHEAELDEFDRHKNHNCCNATQESPCVFPCGCSMFYARCQTSYNRPATVKRKSGCKIKRHRDVYLCQVNAVKAYVTSDMYHRFDVEQDEYYAEILKQEQAALDALMQDVALRDKKIAFCPQWEQSEKEKEMAIVDRYKEQSSELRRLAVCLSIPADVWEQTKRNNSYRKEFLAHNEWLVACLARYVELYGIPCTAIVKPKFSGGADLLVEQCVARKMLQCAVDSQQRPVGPCVVPPKKIKPLLDQMLQWISEPMPDLFTYEAVRYVNSGLIASICTKHNSDVYGDGQKFCWHLCGAIDFAPDSADTTDAVEEKDEDKVFSCREEACMCFSAVMRDEIHIVCRALTRLILKNAAEKRDAEQKTYSDFRRKWEHERDPRNHENDIQRDYRSKMENIMREISTGKMGIEQTERALNGWTLLKRKYDDEQRKREKDYNQDGYFWVLDEQETEMLYDFFKECGVPYTVEYRDLRRAKITAPSNASRNTLRNALRRYYHKGDPVFGRGKTANHRLFRYETVVASNVHLLIDQYRARVYQSVKDGRAAKRDVETVLREALANV